MVKSICSTTIIIYKLRYHNKIVYFKDGNYEILHREDGPAIEYPNGDKEWWINDSCHRENGPAVECFDGYKEWWFEGKRYRNIKSIDDWEKFVKTIILI